MSTWDPERTADYYDAFGEKEWTRFEQGVTPPAGLDVHIRFLERFVKPEEAPDYGHLALKLYRWSELETMLSRHGRVIAAAAAGLLPDLRPEEPELQGLVRRLEAELCEEPGAVSCGQHIAAALRLP